MKEKNPWGILIWLMVFFFLLYFIQAVRQKGTDVDLPYSAFKKSLKAGEIVKLTVSPELIKGQSRTPGGQVVNFKTVPLADPNLVEELEKYNVAQFSGDMNRGWLMPLIMNWGPMLLLIGFWLWMMKGMQGGGKQMMSFSKSKAKLQTTKKTKLSFSDVAGCDEAKEELQEIIQDHHHMYLYP